MLRQFPAMTLLFLLMGFAVAPLCAQSTYFMNSLKAARQYEARGNYDAAGSAYFSILNNNCAPHGTDSSIPAATKILVGRRAAACLTIAARSKMQAPNFEV